MVTSSRARQLVGRAILALLFGAGASAAQSDASPAITERVDALHTMADWANDRLDRMERQGGGDDGVWVRELQSLQGQLYRYDRVLRLGDGSGVEIDSRQLEDLADRLAQLWLDLRGAGEVSAYDNETPMAPPPAVSGSWTTLPRGSNLVVELTTWLSSKSANVGDRFSVLVAEPVYVDGQVAIPSGAVMEGMVTAVDRAGRVSDSGNLHLYIDRLRGPQGQIVDTHGLVVGLMTGEEIKGQGASVGKTVAGAAIGGLLGGLIEGKKGALIGLAVGAGGTLLAQSGKDVDLPQGSVLRVEIQDAFSFDWRWPEQ